jgi:hypothetical protein
MRKLFLSVLGISLLSMLPLIISGNPVIIKGTWGPGGPRSLIIVPAPPTVFVENGELLICFTDAISDLAITVSTENDELAYQDLISGNSGYTLIIPLPPDSYQITLAHKQYGMLTGQFDVE